MEIMSMSQLNFPQWKTNIMEIRFLNQYPISIGGKCKFPIQNTGSTDGNKLHQVPVPNPKFVYHKRKTKKML